MYQLGDGQPTVNSSLHLDYLGIFVDGHYLLQKATALIRGENYTSLWIKGQIFRMQLGITVV